MYLDYKTFITDVFYAMINGELTQIKFIQLVYSGKDRLFNYKVMVAGDKVEIYDRSEFNRAFPDTRRFYHSIEDYKCQRECGYFHETYVRVTLHIKNYERCFIRKGYEFHVGYGSISLYLYSLNGDNVIKGTLFPIFHDLYTDKMSIEVNGKMYDISETEKVGYYHTEEDCLNSTTIKVRTFRGFETICGNEETDNNIIAEYNQLLQEYEDIKERIEKIKHIVNK